jgi:TonB family protein
VRSDGCVAGRETGENAGPALASLGAPCYSRSVPARVARLALALTVAVGLSCVGPRGLAQDAPPAGSPPAEPPAPVRTPPALLEAPPVVLPEGAEPLPEGSSVELVLTLGADGLVTDAQLAAPVRPDVDPLVLEAARAMRFAPATRDGVAVPSRIRFRYAVSNAPETDTGAEAAEETGTGAEAEAETGAGAEAEAGTGAAAETAAAETTEAGDAGGEAELGVEAVVDRPEAGAASRITLTGAELSTVPGTFGEPLRVVASLPGVVRSPFGLGFFLVRGANFQNTGFFVDGFPVPILYHFGAGPAVISSRLVERLRFYPGGYPVSLGRFSAGIVSVETGPPAAESLHVEGEIDLLRASILGVLPFDGGRGSIAIAYRRSYYELLLPYFVSGLEIAYQDWQVRAQYRFDDRVTMSLFLFGSDDLLDQSGALMGGTTSANSNTAIAYEFQRGIARIDFDLGGGGSLRLSGSVGRDRTFFGSRNAGQNAQQFDIGGWLLGLRLDGVFPVAPWLTVNAGFDLLGQSFDVNAVAPLPSGLGEYPRPLFDPQTVTIRSAVARGLPALYTEGVLRLDPVEISAGLRLELLRYGNLTELAPDPRAVARWTIVPEVVAKIATGLFTQAPAVFQTVSTGGNPGLGPQRAWQSSLGLEVDFPLGIEAEVTGFYSQMFDITRFTQSVDPGSGGRRSFFRADQEGRAWGLELLVRRPVEEGFYGWLSYTLSRSERLDPTSGIWEPFAFDQTHVLNLAASYAFDGWRFGARFQLATGRPTFSVCGTIYDADGGDYDATFCDRGERLPTYHQLDVRIDRDFNIENVVTGTVYLDVLNVYYAQNAEGVVYAYDYQSSVPLPGLPILGTLGLRMVVE